METDRQEIRLVTVEPSIEIGDQPVCSLQVACLDDDPQYEALSYAWGDPKITKPVVLQEMQWHVTASLEAAFRRWCHPSQALVFWADAICIILTSIEEKNYQVPLMKSIYGKARVIRVWLREEVDGRDNASACK